MKIDVGGASISIEDGKVINQVIPINCSKKLMKEFEVMCLDLENQIKKLDEEEEKNNE